MDTTRAAEWSPDPSWARIEVIDSHTGGEPFRVVISGLPDIPGDTMIERRAYAASHLDHYRKLLMWEPRGHADMYGGLLGSPTRDNSDLSVLFIHNEGFSTMCGHGIIALTKVVLDTGILPKEDGETELVIDTPAGQVQALAVGNEGEITSVRFRNVPSFAVDLDAVVEVPDLGRVTYDLAFGGAFYAYVNSGSIGVDLGNGAQLIESGRSIKAAISKSRTVEHPDEPELGFLYGVIFTGPAHDPANHSRNVCVFADGEIDRSPTGTGVSGRVAIAHARDELGPAETMTVESIVGSTFVGSWVDEAKVGSYPAVVPQIEGTAHITGRSEFWVDPADELGRGFFIR